MWAVRIQEAAAFQQFFWFRLSRFFLLIWNAGFGIGVLLQLKIVVEVIHRRCQILEFY
jgi:hypothetical protein